MERLYRGRTKATARKSTTPWPQKPTKSIAKPTTSNKSTAAAPRVQVAEAVKEAASKSSIPRPKSVPKAKQPNQQSENRSKAKPTNKKPSKNTEGVPSHAKQDQ